MQTDVRPFTPCQTLTQKEWYDLPSKFANPCFPFRTPVATSNPIQAQPGPDAKEPLTPEDWIEDLALTYPSIGAARIKALLLAQGRRMSTQHIQQVLADKELATLQGRWLALEGMFRNGQQLNSEQIKLLGKMNPAFRERHIPVTIPGHMLLLVILPLRPADCLNCKFGYFALDAYSGYVFVRLHPGREVKGWITLLQQQVLPFFEKHNLRTEKLFTGYSQEYCTMGAKDLLFLDRHGIDHQVLPSRSGLSNGFLERLRLNVHGGFVRSTLAEFSPIEDCSIEQRLTQWVHNYNYHYASPGYPNYGATAQERLLQWDKEVGQRSGLT